MSPDAIPTMICPPSPGRRRPRSVAAASSESSSASLESASAAVSEMSRMTPNMSAGTNCKYTPRRRTATTCTTVALLALLQGSASPGGNAVEAFVQRRASSVSSVRAIRGITGKGSSGSTSSSSSSSSSLNFRQDDAASATAEPSYYMPGMPMPSGYGQSSSTTTTTSTNNAAGELPDTEVRSRMPTWLQTTPQTPTEVDAAMQTLRDAMVTTYLTPSEVHTVLSAIRSSSHGNQSKMGGAAEFCHILVDTMEMGVTSLVAAVRHYCECYDVREREAAHGFSGGTTLLPTGGQSIEMFEMAAQAFASTEAELYGTGTVGGASGGSSSSYSYMYSTYHGAAATPRKASTANNDEADRIASDASGLKRTEAVAHTTFRTQTRRHHRLPSHPGGTHVHRQDAYANMQNLLLSETRDWRSLAIRTAACLYRLRGLQAARDHGPAPAGPLAPEEVRQSRAALHIYAPLASRLGMHRLKNELEGAAFRLQYRRQYDRVMDLGREPRVIYDDNTNGNPNNPHALTVGEGMARVLRRVAENVKGVLDADPTFTEAADDVVVCARVKEPYSLWRKILKTGATRLLDVPDALALRVVLNAKKESPDEPDDVTAARERALCYYVQSLCTKHWEPDLNKEGGRFKDYIDSPKPNGYQSLHYTASTWWGGVDWPLEIQVRTGEMHKIAEYGLAAHFDYKENAKRGGYAGESDPPVYRTYAGSRASAGLHGGDYPASASQPTRLNDETYLQAVQEWHWNQIDGTAYSSSPSYQQRRFEEVQGELNSKIGTGYSPDHNEDRAQRVRARAERIAPYIESFTAAQSDLARNHVFVFLASSEQNPDNGAGPSGTIVSLPSGSCILDALREGAKHFPGVDSNCFQGKAHFGVQRNGMAASSVTEMLKNGDVITLPTVCNAGEVLTP